jgi:hypothetical protein
MNSVLRVRFEYRQKSYGRPLSVPDSTSFLALSFQPLRSPALSSSTSRIPGVAEPRRLRSKSDLDLAQLLLNNSRTGPS